MKPDAEIRSRAELRAWLADNHHRTDTLWLAVYKKHRPASYVPWGDIVKELICVGWIDSGTKRIDEDRTGLRISPRKVGSGWSRINKQHVAELEAAGLLRPAGRAAIERAKADGSWTFLDDIEDLVVPDDLAAALEVGHATDAWQAVTSSRKKRLLYWIKTAKRASTRQTRIDRAVEAALTGVMPA